MANYSAQNSITVKRVRSGDTLFITLELNGVPLFQSVDPDTGAAVPDWTVAANQPIITPKVLSARGHEVTLANHAWKYNGIAITFNGAVSSGFTASSDGRFQLNKTTGALKIVKNLASKDNLASDTLTYSCDASVEGVVYSLTKSIDIMIQNGGTSAYYGYIQATTEQLTETFTSAGLTAHLYCAGVEVSDFTVKWYKDDTLWSGKTTKSVTVGRSDIDGTQLFLCEFFDSGSTTTPVYRAGVRIIDTADTYVINLKITSTNTEVDTGKPVTVTAEIQNIKTGDKETPSGAKWRLDVMDKDSWEVLKTSSTSSIQVTTTETDRDGKQKDVDVLAEVTWTA